jgi:hypothetical protein
MNDSSFGGGGDHQTTSRQVILSPPTCGGIGAPSLEQRAQVLFQRGKRNSSDRLCLGFPGRIKKRQLVEIIDKVIEP